MLADTHSTTVIKSCILSLRYLSLFITLSFNKFQLSELTNFTSHFLSFQPSPQIFKLHHHHHHHHAEASKGSLRAPPA